MSLFGISYNDLSRKIKRYIMLLEGNNDVLAKKICEYAQAAGPKNSHEKSNVIAAMARFSKQSRYYKCLENLVAKPINDFADATLLNLERDLFYTAQFLTALIDELQRRTTLSLSKEQPSHVEYIAQLKATQQSCQSIAHLIARYGRNFTAHLQPVRRADGSAPVNLTEIFNEELNAIKATLQIVLHNEKNEYIEKVKEDKKHHALQIQESLSVEFDRRIKAVVRALHQRWSPTTLPRHVVSPMSGLLTVLSEQTTAPLEAAPASVPLQVSADYGAFRYTSVQNRLQAQTETRSSLAVTAKESYSAPIAHLESEIERNQLFMQLVHQWMDGCDAGKELEARFFDIYRNAYDCTKDVATVAASELPVPHFATMKFFPDEKIGCEVVVAHQGDCGILAWNPGKNELQVIAQPVCDYSATDATMIKPFVRRMPVTPGTMFFTITGELWQHFSATKAPQHTAANGMSYHYYPLNENAIKHILIEHKQHQPFATSQDYLQSLEVEFRRKEQTRQQRLAGVKVLIDSFRDDVNLNRYLDAINQKQPRKVLSFKVLLDYMRGKKTHAGAPVEEIDRQIAGIMSYLAAIGYPGGYKNSEALTFEQFATLPLPQRDELTGLTQSFEPAPVALLRKLYDNPLDKPLLQRVCQTLHATELNQAAAIVLRTGKDPVRMQSLLQEVFKAWDQRAQATARSQATRKTVLLIGLGLLIFVIPGLFVLFTCKTRHNNYYQAAYADLTKDWKVTLSRANYEKSKQIKKDLKALKPGYEAVDLESGNADSYQFSLLSRRHYALKSLAVDTCPADKKPEATDLIDIYVAAPSKAAIWRQACDNVPPNSLAARQFREYNEPEALLAGQWQQHRDEDVQAIKAKM